MKKSLTDKCKHAANLIGEIMVEARSFSLRVGPGTRGLSFEVDRLGFDQMFEGMPAAITPTKEGHQVKKSVRLCDEVEFCCYYDETPEERVVRMMAELSPHKRTEILAELMSHMGTKK